MFLAFLSGCHTYFFQPVEKQIIGTWIKSPQGINGITEEWTFNDDNTLRIKEYQYGALLGPKDHADSLEYIEWKIQNKITKHFLFTDNYQPFYNNAESKPKWLIIKISKSELYLSSIEGKARGAWQWGFIKK